MDTKKTIQISPDGFINMLIHQNGGAVIDELNREMVAGIEAVLDNGGCSEVIFKIKIREIKNLTGAFDIEPTISVKHPKEKPLHTAMFLTAGNGLSEQLQKQKELPLQEVTPNKSNLHELPTNLNKR